MARVNLNTIANEVATVEGLERSIGVAQVKEVLGILGERWRELPPDEMLAEVRCLVQRAGQRSGHRA